MAHSSGTPSGSHQEASALSRKKACGNPQAFTVVVHALSWVEYRYFLAASTCLGGFIMNAAITKPSAARMATGMNISKVEPLNMSLE